jgi:hypothetical protein
VTYGNDYIDVQAKVDYEKNDIRWLRHKCALIRASASGNQEDLAYRLHCWDLSLPYEREDGQFMDALGAFPSGDGDAAALPLSGVREELVAQYHLEQATHLLPPRVVSACRATWRIILFLLTHMFFIITLGVVVKVLPSFAPLYRIVVGLIELLLTLGFWFYGRWVALRPRLEAWGLGFIAQAIEYTAVFALANYTHVWGWLSAKAIEIVCDQMCPCGCLVTRGGGA